VILGRRVVRATATFGDTVILVDGTPETVTGEDGSFVLLDLRPGQHWLEASRLGSLTSRAFLVVPAAGLVDLGPTLLELGDTFRDNRIDIIDAELVRAGEGRCRETPGYQATLDLNGDGCIDRVDYVIVMNNIGKVGPSRWGIPPD
jgi:hypothetical protein